MGTILHHIYQKTGMTPDEFYEKPPGIRAFMVESIKVALNPKIEEREDR